MSPCRQRLVRMPSCPLPSPPPPPAIFAPGRGAGRGVGEEEGGSVTSGHVSALIAPGRSLSRPPTTDDQDKDQVVSHGNWLVFTFTLQHQQQQHGYTQGAAMALTARGTTTLPPSPPAPKRSSAPPSLDNLKETELPARTKGWQTDRIPSIRRGERKRG